MIAKSKKTESKERGNKFGRTKAAKQASVVIVTPREVADEFDRLMNSAADQIRQSDALNEESERLFNQALLSGHDSAKLIYGAGKALTEAREKKPPGKSWSDCLKPVGISRTSAWEAMKLYELAPCEAEIAEMTRTEAKVKFGIVKPKRKAVSRKAAADNSDQSSPKGEDSTGANSDGLEERKSHRNDAQVAGTIKPHDDPDDVVDGDGGLEDLDAHEEAEDHTEDFDADDDEESELDESKANGSEVESDTQQEASPLEGMDEVIAWLDIVEHAINAKGIDLDSRSGFLVRVKEAQARLVRISKAVTVDSTAD